MGLIGADMNIEQLKVAGRYTLTAASSVVATLVTFHLVTAGDASNITAALNQIGSGLTSIIAGVTALIPVATAVWGVFRSSTTSQVAQVEASPDLHVVPLTPAGQAIVTAAATPVSVAAVANKVPAIVAVFLAAGLLAGCAGITNLYNAATSATITQSTLDAARTSYDGTVLSPSSHYRDLPLCMKGQTFVANQCRTHSLTVKLQKSDSDVEAAFNGVQAQISSGNTTGIAAAYSVLQITVKAAQSLISDNGIRF